MAETSIWLLKRNWWIKLMPRPSPNQTFLFFSSLWEWEERRKVDWRGHCGGEWNCFAFLFFFDLRVSGGSKPQCSAKRRKQREKAKEWPGPSINFTKSNKEKQTFVFIWFDWFVDWVVNDESNLSLLSLSGGLWGGHRPMAPPREENEKKRDWLIHETTKERRVAQWNGMEWSEFVSWVDGINKWNKWTTMEWNEQAVPQGGEPR